MQAQCLERDSSAKGSCLVNSNITITYIFIRLAILKVLLHIYSLFILISILWKNSWHFILQGRIQKINYLFKTVLLLVNSGPLTLKSLSTSLIFFPLPDIEMRLFCSLTRSGMYLQCENEYDCPLSSHCNTPVLINSSGKSGFAGKCFNLKR